MKKDKKVPRNMSKAQKEKRRNNMIAKQASHLFGGRFDGNNSLLTGSSK